MKQQAGPIFTLTPATHRSSSRILIATPDLPRKKRRTRQDHLQNEPPQLRTGAAPKIALHGLCSGPARARQSRELNRTTLLPHHLYVAAAWSKTASTAPSMRKRPAESTTPCSRRRGPPAQSRSRHATPSPEKHAPPAAERPFSNPNQADKSLYPPDRGWSAYPEFPVRTESITLAELNPHKPAPYSLGIGRPATHPTFPTCFT